jgi:hypothetical protein
MKSIVWLLLLSLPHLALAEDTSNQTSPATEPLKVLFIGNSFTYYNNMPAMLARLTASPGSPRRIQVDAVTAGGATLGQLWEWRLARKKIQEHKWDYVVLQEQSARPADNSEKMAEFARKFDTEIRNSGAKTVLYLTWAHRGQPETRPLIEQAYFALGRELNAQVAPVGPAWQAALARAPNIPLYQSDSRHPTATGSYIAACVFYLVLLGNQLSCPAIEQAGISQRDAAVARSAASEAVSAVRQ